MASNDDFTKAKDFAKAALAAMVRHAVPPTPRNYSLWYAHVSGSTPDLSRTIETMVSNKQDFTAERSEELFHRFVGSDSQLAVLRQTGDQLEQAVSQILNYVETARGDAQAYGRTLDTYTTQLGETPAIGNLPTIVAGIVAETQRITARNELLESQLSQTTGELTELRQNLVTVRREAMTDALTGIANRKFFEERMEGAAREAMETGAPLSLLFIDIDHFKRFNDTFGHQVGDQVLRLVAKTLIDCVKGRDTTARYGGEEFVIILPQTRIIDALRLAEQIRSTMMRHRIVSKSSREEYGTITLSIGVGGYRPGEPIDEVLHRADAALYHAKRNGRNRVASETEIVEAGEPATV
jgi:diguanylate cyclase